MKPQEYIQTSLNDLLKSVNISLPEDKDDLKQEILRLTLSKKFRKYSVGVEPLEHIKASIESNVDNNEPIKFTLPFGAYKLWRLKETPEADWAELFTFMYFTKWLKPICDIYKPGIWFDFFSDDVIIPRMNNIQQEDVAAYRESFQSVLNFIKPYQPSNFQMTLTRVIDQYKNQQDFENDYNIEMSKLKDSLNGKLPELDKETRAMIQFNVKATTEQMEDPFWKEKVKLIHDSYSAISKRRPYYRPIEQHKIMVVTTPLWGMLTPGSTKDSTVKFWVGSGVLRPLDGSFRQIIFSPSQLEKNKFTTEKIKITGLDGKNFKSIRVISS